MYKFKNITFNKPIAFFDLETTGLLSDESRIVEWSVLRLEPDGSSTSVTRRCNPQQLIPERVSGIHGIFNHHVDDLPPFKDQADEMTRLMLNCYISGFNIIRFDIPFLNNELDRIRYPLIRFSNRDALDVLQLFQRRHPDLRYRKGASTLSAAYRMYHGQDFDGAHGAASDTLATAKVLDAMVAKHSLPMEFEILQRGLS